MTQDNRKWMRCGNCGSEHLEGPCPYYGDPRLPPKAESNRSIKASLAAERSELDRLRAEMKALKTDIATYVRISSEQATDNEGLHAENARLRGALQGLHDDILEYVKINHLGAVSNHWLAVARAALGGQEHD